MRIRRLCRSSFFQKELASTIPGYHICILHIVVFVFYECINNTRLLCITFVFAFCNCFHICIWSLHLYQQYQVITFVSAFGICISICILHLHHLYLHLVHSCICNCIDLSMFSSVMQFKKGSFEVKPFLATIITSHTKNDFYLFSNSIQIRQKKKLQETN